MVMVVQHMLEIYMIDFHTMEKKLEWEINDNKQLVCLRCGHNKVGFLGNEMLNCPQKNVFFNSIQRSSCLVHFGHFWESYGVGNFLGHETSLLYFTATPPNKAWQRTLKTVFLISVRRFSSLKRQESILSFSTSERRIILSIGMGSTCSHLSHCTTENL